MERKSELRVNRVVAAPSLSRYHKLARDSGGGKEVKQGKRQTLLLFLAVGLFLGLGIGTIVLKWNDVKEVAGQANWHLTPFALLFAGVSYFLIGYSFLGISRLFGVTLKAWDLIEIGYVTNVLDSLLPAVGLPGLSLRVLLLKHRGAGTNEAVAPSLFRSYFNNVIFIAMLPFSLIYTLVSHPLPASQANAFIVTAVLIILFAAVITAGVFSGWLRQTLLRLVSRTWRFFTRRDIEKSLQDFATTFSHGVDHIRQNPGQVSIIIGVILGSWLFTAVVIWFCFISLNTNLNFGLILTGFLIGRTFGVISFLPGGIGTQDASMVGFYTLFGVPLAEAILIAILFRVVYYFIPFAISLGFYRHLLRGQPKR